MKKTKENILRMAQQLFNKEGVADVSIRKIAAELCISHTNLIYHFKTKNELLEQLHVEILATAKRENEKLQQEENLILGLYKTTQVGFQVLYDYRFFLIDLNYIMRINPSLHAFFLEVEQLRAKMYRDYIQRLIERDYMRLEDFEGEFDLLIKRIRTFSDYWIASSQIYNTQSPETLIEDHVQLFMSMFYPYLTTAGKQAYRTHIPNGR